MNLLETILKANNGALVREMAQNLGIDERQARSGIDGLLPSLSRGLQRNAAQPGGLEALMDALKSGNHQRYVDHPEEITRSETVDDGNAILGHIFGKKDVSRNVSGRAAEQTGLDSSILKKLLPMLAAAAMGSLGKQVSGGGGLSSLGGGRQGGSSPGMVMLESFLDSNKDGSILDDVLGMAKRFF